MALIKDSGIQPELRKEMSLRDKALAGDIVLSITPATVTPVPTAAAWSRNVVIELQTAAGEVHTWYNKATTSILSVSDDSTAGTASVVPATTLTLVEGRAVAVVSGDAAAWLNTEKDTLTVADLTILGAIITGGTSVETFTT
ncbi:MAG: hypothetical protein PF693_10960 [Spirochaetia bacterium]|jgi:hypothetical protein|nr:hypothetical protein [Spirochaetia bacterium]